MHVCAWCGCTHLCMHVCACMLDCVQCMRVCVLVCVRVRVCMCMCVCEHASVSGWLPGWQSQGGQAGRGHRKQGVDRAGLSRGPRWGHSAELGGREGRRRWSRAPSPYLVSDASGEHWVAVAMVLGSLVGPLLIGVEGQDCSVAGGGWGAEHSAWASRACGLTPMATASPGRSRPVLGGAQAHRRSPPSPRVAAGQPGAPHTKAPCPHPTALRRTQGTLGNSRRGASPEDTAPTGRKAG